ncbi:MAG: LysR family transcriptional regulator [Neisseria sp.]|nr:LysR family transcriptional regulator [Neisseria sp.]
MPSENFNELHAFVLVAEAGSFTQAARQLGVSPSALSHSIRGLETRLGIRLLTRTTRSVSTTEAGEQLLQQTAPLFGGIMDEVEALSAFRDTPAGTVRINSSEHAAYHIIYPKLRDFLPQYPDIRVEVHTNNRWVDIVTQRFDMGVRLGDDVAKDMVAVRLSPEMRMCVVAAPAYLADRQPPATPQALAAHRCLTLKINHTDGLPMAWEFRESGKTLEVPVAAQMTFNSNLPLHMAALDGMGFAWLPLSMVAADIAAGRLVEVLADFAISYPGHYLYYPGRRENSPVFKLLVEALRWRG